METIQKSSDFYEILGLSRNCTKDEIQKAYHQINYIIDLDKLLYMVILIKILIIQAQQKSFKRLLKLILF